MSASAYCHRLKTLSDALADCGYAIGERALVHQLIRGLNPKFHVLKQMLPQMLTFPPFIQARDQLTVVENTITSSTADTTATALVVTNGSTMSSSNPAAPRRIKPTIVLQLITLLADVDAVGGVEPRSWPRRQALQQPRTTAQFGCPGAAACLLAHLRNTVASPMDRCHGPRRWTSCTCWAGALRQHIDGTACTTIL